MKIRDRIKELRRVKASDLVPNPRNNSVPPNLMRAIAEHVKTNILQVN